MIPVASVRVQLLFWTKMICNVDGGFNDENLEVRAFLIGRAAAQT